jgi:Tfp pilus assembly PilM family ATPase
MDSRADFVQRSYYKGVGFLSKPTAKYQLTHRSYEVVRLSDVSSTEKLLKVIRSKGEDPPPQAVIAEPVPPRTPFKAPSLSLSLKKKQTVGIDIGNDYVRMVKAAEISGGVRQILDRRRFTLPHEAPVDSPQFAAFLKAALATFCVTPGVSDLWVMMSAARVEVRHIRIPKVVKNQIDNAIYWTARKENPFDEKETVFDFELQGEVIEQGIPKLSAMVYTASRQEIENLKNIFSKIGWPLTGITIVPFSVQNLFRTEWIPTPEGSAVNMFIGNDFSRIDIYSGGNLVMTRGIRAGLNSMVETLTETYNDLKLESISLKQGRKILGSLSPDLPPLGETDAGFGLTKDEIFEMIQPALERLVSQAERTFKYYASEMAGDRIVKVFVSCAMNIYEQIIGYVGAQLGIESEGLDPLRTQDSIPPCRDVDDSDCLAERIAFGPALGLALSDRDKTPDFIYTYKEKERDVSIKRINKAVFAVFLALVLICSGIFFYQNRVIGQRKAIIDGLEKELSQLGSSVDRDQLMTMAAKISQRRELSKLYAERYLGMVLISEIAALTPENVRLLNLKVNLGPVAGKDTVVKAAAEVPKAPVGEIVVEGLIMGERQKLETSLAGYMIALEASPLFNQVAIQKNSIEPYQKGEALNFTLNLKVEEKVHG